MTAVSTDLASWLLARIAEDEAAAKAAIAMVTGIPNVRGEVLPGGTGNWVVETHVDDYFGDKFHDIDFPTDALVMDNTSPSDGWVIAETRATGIPPTSPVDTTALDHIARWDPARVLAECEAKRRIVELHKLEWMEHPEDKTRDVSFCMECGGDEGRGWCRTLRLVALPYADRPDYHEEWRP